MIRDSSPGQDCVPEADADTGRETLQVGAVRGYHLGEVYQSPPTSPVPWRRGSWPEEERIRGVALEMRPEARTAELVHPPTAPQCTGDARVPEGWDCRHCPPGGWRAEPLGPRACCAL